MLTPEQCRMARAGLGLSLDAAAKASQVSRSSIVRFENGRLLRPLLCQALKAALEKRGAVFTPAGVEVETSRGEGAGA